MRTVSRLAGFAGRYAHCIAVTLESYATYIAIASRWAQGTFVGSVSPWGTTQAGPPGSGVGKNKEGRVVNWLWRMRVWAQGPSSRFAFSYTVCGRGLKRQTLMPPVWRRRSGTGNGLCALAPHRALASIFVRAVAAEGA